MSVAESRPGRYYRGTVAYDGTDFCGFQVQVEQRTVQGVLEEALEAITQEPVRVIAAGRTDSGVQALGQVVAFRTGWQRSTRELHRAWNALLPQERQMVVKEALARPHLTPRELACWLCDHAGFSISESSVYRVLKAKGLLPDRAADQAPAAKEFRHKTRRLNELWPVRTPRRGVPPGPSTRGGATQPGS